MRINSGDFTPEKRFGSIDQHVNEVVQSVEYFVNQMKFNVLIRLEDQLQQPNVKLSLDWSIFKQELYHVLNSQIVNKKCTRDICVSFKIRNCQKDDFKSDSSDEEEKKEERKE